MLIESTKIRDLLNTTASDAAELDEVSHETGHADVEKAENQRTPDSYGISLNPIPALVIILLGIMMSSHHQSSMVSTMVHKQWGNLLVGAGLARGFTYVLLYLKPPRSVLPSRPPTELLAAFGLIAGGVIFMASVSLSPSTAFDCYGVGVQELTFSCRAMTPCWAWRTATWTPCSCTPSQWVSWVC